EACLTDYRWETVSVGDLMPKFAPEVVKSVPTSRWDSLLALHDETRLPRSPQDTALLIGRALYGVDPEFLRHGDGWIRLLTRIAVTGEPLPLPIARAVTDLVPLPSSLCGVSLPDEWTDASDARTALCSALASDPTLYEPPSP